MKPSERIKEIYDSFKNGEHLGVEHAHAIIKYLDEEYEKNKPCEHKDSYRVDSIMQDDVYYNVCNDCGVLFLA